MSKLFSLRNEVLNINDVVVFDTETTGIDGTAEICQLSIVDLTGYKLFDELIKPTKPISESVSKIHGITDEIVSNKRGISYYWNYICENFFRGKIVAGYNVMFDIRMLNQSISAVDSKLSHQKSLSPLMIIDVMQFAIRLTGLTTYPKLEALAQLRGVSLSEESSFHNALYDAKITAAILKDMVEI